MKVSLLVWAILASIVIPSNALWAQEKIDLTRQPGLTPGNPSNAVLLRSASAPQPDTNFLFPKGINNGPFNSKGFQQGEMRQMQSTEFKLGNQKATSTIYYDNDGRIKGTNMTIGGK